MVHVIPDCYLVSIKGSSGGQDVVNVIGVKAPGNTPISVANAVLSAWKVAGGPLSKLPTVYQMREVTAMDISSSTGQVDSVADATFGSVGAQLATNGACALVTYGSGSRAKSTKGRMYFGPMVESNINSDGRTLVAAATYTTAFQAFKASLEVNNRQWVVLSRKNQTSSPIIQITTQVTIATQRRRIR
jgi:hypothetical protein